MIYGILSTIAFIIILPAWLFVGCFNKKLTAGLKQKLGFYNNLPALIGKTIIFYGVSVGEVTAMENLIKKTRESFPESKIVVMTGTKTGQEIAHKKLGGTADFITYFPLDFSFCVNNMLTKIKPDAIFVMETELWPNFAYITNKKKIPTFIINARISDRTYKSYKKLSFFFGPILKKYKNIYPQSKQDMDKLISIGANPETTEIMGNLKFDIKAPDISTLNFQKNSDYKIILAGSTHFGENEIVLDVFNELKKEISNVKLLIVPRHLGGKYDFRCGYRSKNDTFENNDIILLDTMGELGKFYAVCDLAFLGGSFAKKGGDNFEGKGVGGHNPLEAAIFNKPTISGPSIHNFKDIYAILTSTDASIIVKNSEEFIIAAKKLLTDNNFYEKASKDCEIAFEQNKGALNFVINVIKGVVS